MKNRLLLTMLLFLFLPVLLHADYLKVQRQAAIRAQASTKSETLAAVEQGTLLSLQAAEQKGGYYKVSVPDSAKSGWIYRSMVRRFAGDMPRQASAAAEASAAADASGASAGVYPADMTAADKRFAQRHLKLGKPQAVYERFREGYTVGYDARLKIPLWVQYELRTEDLDGSVARTNDYRADTSVPCIAHSDPDDYSSSGYDQGHMAPAQDMTRSEAVMRQSFLLSNMSPQIHVGFNGQIWMQLESAVRGWVEQRGPLTIIIGPIFEVQEKKVAYDVIGANHVAVPTHFFKIVVDAKNPDRPEALAFRMKNANLTGHRYEEYLCTIREIEQATGLDFLSALPQKVQDEVETTKASRVW